VPAPVRAVRHLRGAGRNARPRRLRVVVGHWQSPLLGPFTDVMAERPDGHRILLAPDERVARFAAATYG
jgi:hypothetical protein